VTAEAGFVVGAAERVEFSLGDVLGPATHRGEEEAGDAVEEDVEFGADMRGLQWRAGAEVLG
jgi:hypothetical protein